MNIAPPINPGRDDLHRLLATRNRDADWLNASDGEPFGEANIARTNLARLSTVIPWHYRSAIPTLPEVRAWVDSVVAIARNEQEHRPVAHVVHGPSLLLLGPTGVGKTFQAFGAIRDSALGGALAPWVFTTSADLYASLRPRHGIDSEAEFRKYRDARLLLIDDLGAAKASEFTEEVNFRLVNWRYEHHLPTLMTSNVLPRELAARMGDRVASRLVEMCQRVVIEGTDRRRAAA
ncbi:ATP-binding protein [Streptomyces xiamenensis]|uniref:ATP-binding protein n=1 Tax=Streptomyces xiamenensis TaxID=408015 RepID=UPI0035E2A723